MHTTINKVIKKQEMTFKFIHICTIFALLIMEKMIIFLQISQILEKIH